MFTWVPIHIPKVSGSMLWPRLNASDEPRIRESKYDFPLLAMPAIDSTDTGSRICDKNCTVDGTISKRVRVTDGKRGTLSVAGSYLRLFGRTRGSEVGLKSEPSLAANKDTFLNVSMFRWELYLEYSLRLVFAFVSVFGFVWQVLRQRKGNLDTRRVTALVEYGLSEGKWNERGLSRNLSSNTNWNHMTSKWKGNGLFLKVYLVTFRNRHFAFTSCGFNLSLRIFLNHPQRNMKRIDFQRKYFDIWSCMLRRRIILDLYQVHNFTPFIISNIWVSILFSLYIAGFRSDKTMNILYCLLCKYYPWLIKHGSRVFYIIKNL